MVCHSRWLQPPTTPSRCAEDPKVSLGTWWSGLRSRQGRRQIKRWSQTFLMQWSASICTKHIFAKSWHKTELCLYDQLLPLHSWIAALQPICWIVNKMLISPGCPPRALCPCLALQNHLQSQQSGIVELRILVLFLEFDKEIREQEWRREQDVQKGSSTSFHQGMCEDSWVKLIIAVLHHSHNSFPQLGLCFQNLSLLSVFLITSFRNSSSLPQV